MREEDEFRGGGEKRKGGSWRMGSISTGCRDVRQFLSCCVQSSLEL